MNTNAGATDRRRWRAMLLLVSLVGAMAVTSPAAAHLGLTGTDPADGARLVRSPQQITLTFSKVADPVGSGFRLTDGDGQKIATAATSPDGGRTWRVRPVRPLASDRYRLARTVVAADAHTRSGTVSFEVLATAAVAPPGTSESFEASSADVPLSVTAPRFAP